MQKNIPGMVLLIVLFWFGLVTAQESCTLRYQFHPGQILKYKSIETGYKTFRIEGFDPLETKTLLDMQFTIRAEKDTSAVIPDLFMSFDKAETTVRVSGRLMYPDVVPLMGFEQTVVIDDRGYIQDLPQLNMFPRIRMSQGDNVGRNFVYDFKDFFQHLPEQPVQKGDKWEVAETDTIEDAGVTIINKTIKYEFKDLVDEYGYHCAHITGKVNGKVEKSIQMMGEDSKTKGGVKGKFQFLFALNEGIMVFQDVQITLSGEMEVYGVQEYMGWLTDTSTKTIELVQ